MEAPTATSLRDIYPEDAIPIETERWERLLAQFVQKYGRQAEFVARSPGRVNIIGEVLMPFHSLQQWLTIAAHRLFPLRSASDGRHSRLPHGRSRPPLRR